MAERKVALVTGGSSGIGLAFTKSLLGRSYHVIVVARDQNKFDKLDLRRTCEFKQADVTDWDAMSRVFKYAYDKYGHLDVVDANAGILEESPLFWDNGKGPEPVKPNMSVVDTNLIGVINTVSLAVHYMRRQNADKKAVSGKIVMTASAVAIHGEATEPIYVSTKHGLAGLVRACAPVLAGENITINAICPSFTLTPMSEPWMELAPSYLWSEQSDVVAAFEQCIDSDVTGALLEVTHTGTFDRSQPYPERAAEWIRGSLSYR